MWAGDETALAFITKYAERNRSYMRPCLFFICIPRNAKNVVIVICLFSMVMFSQEADQNRCQRSDSIAADLTPFLRVNDRSPTTTASTSSSWRQMRLINGFPHIIPLRPLQCPFTRSSFHFSLSNFPEGRGEEGL